MTGRSGARGDGRPGWWGAVAVLVMTALTVLYVAFAVQYAIILLTATAPLAKGLGVALLVMPAIAVWYLVREGAFLLGGHRLLRRLEAEGALPVDDLPRLPSGRIDPEAAKERFPAFQAEAEVAPQSWRAWLRLALAYDAAGDRPRARWATRTAIRLARREPR